MRLIFRKVNVKLVDKIVMAKKKLELLAPAKNLEVGCAAIDAGADAVYIGAPKFGARLAAGNSLEDIEQLVKYAHFFRAKVYLVLNTILFDSELEEAQKLIWDAWNIGVDAIIVQDMGILEMDLPPVPLFASTQTNNQTPEKVKFLEKIGMQRVILARELSLEAIKKIREKTKVDLEFFVQGALCVCYSGQCYFSQAISGRSANRGACCQPCRMQYDLINEAGDVLETDKHLLSLKDLNLSDYVEDLVDAGIASFKIEGRLKDMDYVVNTTARYRQILDELIARRKDLVRASEGVQTLGFTPELSKTFNRGFSSYFLNGRSKEILSPLTPKSVGGKMGRIVEVGGSWIKLDTTGDWQAGDGVCFFVDNELMGTNVVGFDRGRIFLNTMFEVKIGAEVYRNLSIAFDKIIKSKKAVQRAVVLDFALRAEDDGFVLVAMDTNGVQAEVKIKQEKVLAKNPTVAVEMVKSQLSKLGGTGYVAGDISCVWDQPYFLPLSVLNGLRRTAVEKITEKRLQAYERETASIKPNDFAYPEKTLDYHGNVSNELAKKFYTRHGVEKIDPAFELSEDITGKNIMTTKHCLRFYEGLCPKQGGDAQKNKTMYLVNGDKKYRLEFDCTKCEMGVFLE